MLNPETPSKSLLGTDTSSSMLFSPPSILKVNSFLNPLLVSVNISKSDIDQMVVVLMTLVGRYCITDEGDERRVRKPVQKTGQL